MPLESRRGFNVPGAGIARGYELLEVGSGKQTANFCKDYATLTVGPSLHP